MLAGFFLFGGNIGERFTKRAQSFQHLVPLGLMGLARTGILGTREDSVISASDTLIDS